MAPFLALLLETVPAEDSNNIFGATNWEPFAHARATSTTLAPADNRTGEGSNHNSRASFAFRIASSSVSPAEAQPGSSGKKAAHRLVSESNSTTNRSFIPASLTYHEKPGNHPVSPSPRLRDFLVAHSPGSKTTRKPYAGELSLLLSVRSKVYGCELT